jgi:hypothetical protein
MSGDPVTGGAPMLKSSDRYSGRKKYPYQKKLRHVSALFRSSRWKRKRRSCSENIDARTSFQVILTEGNSGIIKIRHICRRSASLHNARHQPSLKTGAHSGRWNLVIPQNSRVCCSWRTASSISQGSHKPFRSAEDIFFSPAWGNLPAKGLYIPERLNERIDVMRLA